MSRRVKLSPIIQITPQGTFRAQFSRGGQKFDKTFKLRKDAQEYIDKFAADTLTFGAFIETGYKRSPEWRKLKGPSKDAYNSRLTRIVAALGTTPIAAIDKQMLDGYVTDRLEQVTRLGRPTSSDTVRQEIVLIGRILNIAVGYGKIPANPASKVEKPKQNRRLIRVEPAQRNNLLLLALGRATRHRVFRGKDCGIQPANWPRALEAGRFLFILSDIGGRASELATLPVQNLDFANECLHLDDTKGNVPDRRYFSTISAKLLKQQLLYIADHPKNPDGLLFPTRNGTAHDYQGSVDIARELQLVDQDFHSHACRREFVSNARELGYRDPDLAKLIGVDVATLARYDVSTGETAEETERRHQLHKLRNLQLRDAMGDAQASVELQHAIATSSAFGRGGGEIVAMDEEYCVKVEPQQSAEDVLKRAVQRGEIGTDQILQLLVEAKARETKS